MSSPAEAVLRTLFRLHLRYRERAIEDMAAKRPGRASVVGWYTIIVEHLRTLAGRTEAARALLRAGFVASDFAVAAADDRAPNVLSVCEFTGSGPARQLRIDLAADTSATFVVVVENGRLKSVEFNADVMWLTFRHTLQPSAYERMAAAIGTQPAAAVH